MSRVRRLFLGFPQRGWRSFATGCLFAALLVAGSTSAVRSAETPPNKDSSPIKPAAAVLFEASVQAIFKSKCLKCHNAQTQKAELDLSSRKGLLNGGESGPALNRDDLKSSLLLEMIADGEMPPEDEKPLTPEEIAVIRRWVESGAKFAKSGRATHVIDQHSIVPIMDLRCTVCHGLRRKEAGLDLRTKASMLAGGKSGPAIVLGKPAESLVLKRIHAGEMPPRRDLVSVSIKVIQPPEIDTLTKWIAAGAPETPIKATSDPESPDPLVSDADRKFWAFQPPQPHETPDVATSQNVRNFIDAFVLHRLESKQLPFNPEADRATLLRRASLDLTGLPPTSEETRKFLNDPDPLAYEHLIDRLLESPRYGERWARHWLDVAGFAESEGIQNTDKFRPHTYRYRDYVIRAFNADKPYDRFLHEQIAGDELADYDAAKVITEELADNLVATGFLRLGVDGTFANITNFVPDRLQVVADEIDVLSSSVMGLTMKCCRCHSHKFDPLPQRDYYRLIAIFKGAFDQNDWLKPERTSGAPGVVSRYLPHVTTAERTAWDASEKQLLAQIAALRAELAKQQKPLSDKHLEKRYAELPEAIRADVRAALSAAEKSRTEIQKYLAEKFAKRLTINADELKKLEPEFKKSSERIDGEIKAAESRRTPEPLIRALWDRGEPSPTYLLRRGNYLTPGRLIDPGVPAVLTNGKTKFAITPPWPGAKKTGRRLAFARWLTQPEHPLTARVMVNRIWKHHFGRGIVTSLGNFGRTGTLPTHPQLLDRLALQFIENGWSIKAMHRLMMTSATYRQSSKITEAIRAGDPENELLSHMPLNRMDAEVLRDSLMRIAGKLDTTQYGPSAAVTTRKDGLVTTTGGSKGYRRSIYVLQRRRSLPTLLENFDLPQMSPNCIERSESIVATQALHLLNNGMVQELSQGFAAKVREQAGDDPAKQVEQAYLVAICREPSPAEREAALQVIAELTKQWEQANSDKKENSLATQRALESFCHALINSAAFIYID